MNNIYIHASLIQIGRKVIWGLFLLAHPKSWPLCINSAWFKKTLLTVLMTVPIVLFLYIFILYLIISHVSMIGITYRKTWLLRNFKINRLVEHILKPNAIFSCQYQNDFTSSIWRIFFICMLSYHKAPNRIK